MEPSEVYDRIRRILSALAGRPDLRPSDITPDSHLLLDLALTSLQFVDMTLALEEELGIEEYPIQAWLDAQQLLGPEAFKVRGLVDSCVSLLVQERSPRSVSSVV